VIQNDRNLFYLSRNILPNKDFIKRNKYDTPIAPIVATIKEISNPEDEHDPLEHARQICIWGGLIANKFREIDRTQEENIDQFALIVNKDHAIEILERNARKAKEFPRLRKQGTLRTFINTLHSFI